MVVMKVTERIVVGATSISTIIMELLVVNALTSKILHGDAEICLILTNAQWDSLVIKQVEFANMMPKAKDLEAM